MTNPGAFYWKENNRRDLESRPDLEEEFFFQIRDAWAVYDKPEECIKHLKEVFARYDEEVRSLRNTIEVKKGINAE